MAHRFLALEVALQLAQALRPVIEKIRRHDRYLASQVQDATTSSVLNVAEGDGKSSLRDQARYFEIARGSTREVRAGVRLAMIRGYIGIAEQEAIDEIADHLCAVLSRLIGRGRV